MSRPVNAQGNVAAKQVLSELTIADVRNNPVVPYEEDCVTRLIQTISMKPNTTVKTGLSVSCVSMS